MFINPFRFAILLISLVVFFLALTTLATFDPNAENRKLPEETMSNCDANGPIDCTDPEVFHSMIRVAIDHFKNIHFYRFGKAVRGGNDSACDMAWRFKPKSGKNATTFSKDYRRFVIQRDEDCSFSVAGMGEYHSGVNARKRKKKQAGFEKSPDKKEPDFSLPYARDSLPTVESEEAFVHGRYLVYFGGGDRCKNMKHYLWSFMCFLGEAQYLNRTLVMDLSVCLNSMYSSSDQDEEGKDFRFYFDFEHLKDSASVLEQDRFWSYWSRWSEKYELKLHYVEDYRVTPMKLKMIKHALIMRRFGSVEPDNYWYKVCEGKVGSVVQKPWDLIKKSKRLMDIVSAIVNRLNKDYDSLHVVRGGKDDYDALVSAMTEKIEEGRKVFVVADESDESVFNSLKGKYSIHFLLQFKDLWGENSEWQSETAKLNNGISVEFDGYMKLSVAAEVFLRGRQQMRLAMI